MFKYTICNNINTDTHIVRTSNYIIVLRFYVLNYWALQFSVFKDDYVKALYLPMLNSSINYHEK